MSHELEYYESLNATAVHYLERLGIAEIEVVEQSKDSGIRLEDITAFIQINGSMEGGFLFSVQDKLAQMLAHKYMLEEISDGEAAEMAVEIVAEIANVISGNALTDREERDIFLGNPLMIVTRKAEIRAKGKRLFVQAYKTANGTFQCIYIPMDHKTELASILAVELE